AARAAARRAADPPKDTFGDGEFVPLRPYFRQLLGQVFLEFVRFCAPRADPFQQLGIPARDRERPPDHTGRNR
ncbi:hypothetical protein ACE14D_09865, partial [Streptomyces sp. Act-28]